MHELSYKKLKQRFSEDLMNSIWRDCINSWNSLYGVVKDDQSVEYNAGIDNIGQLWDFLECHIVDFVEHTSNADIKPKVSLCTNPVNLLF